jgi:hypothetical protein
MSEIIKDKSVSHRSFSVARFLVYLNCLYWVSFFVIIGIRVVPFTDRNPDFEEVLPVFKFGTWALPVELENGNLFTTMYLLQMPSYWASVYATNHINKNESRKSG